MTKRNITICEKCEWYKNWCQIQLFKVYLTDKGILITVKNLSGGIDRKYSKSCSVECPYELEHLVLE